MHLSNSHSSTYRNLLTGRIDRPERIEPPGRDNHVSFRRQGSTHQSGIATLGHDCDVVLRAQLENMAHLTRVRWSHNDRRGTNEPTCPISAVAGKIISQDVGITNYLLQRFNELRAQRLRSTSHFIKVQRITSSQANRNNLCSPLGR